MSRPVKRTFTPKNPNKYNGTYPIIARSSWEWEFCTYCDLHPDVMQWSSESVKIPYGNPLNGQQSIYIPDFLVTYTSKGGNQPVTKLIEIKPLHEATESHARNSNDVAIRVKNEAKWGAATQWAMRRGIEFLVLTEAELFNNHSNRKGRSAPIKAVGKEQVKALKPKAPKRKKPLGMRTSRRLAKSSVSKKRSNKSRTTSSVGKVRKATKL